MTVTVALADRTVAPDLKTRAERAARVAAKFAHAVDREARFPSEAFAAIKAERLLSVMVPSELGGDGLSFEDAASVVSTLAGGCGSTGLIYAMHQIQIATIMNSSMASAWHRRLLKRVSAEQLVLGSATTEGGIGGDIRSSSCAVVRNGDRISIDKAGTVISYGRDSDVIMTTARRNPDAPPSDQVMVALLREDVSLKETGDWDALGMRGTTSVGFTLSGTASLDQICGKSFGEIAAQSMMPTAHIFWSAAWHGIAADAFMKAQALVRSRARDNPGAPVAGQQRLAIASGRLQLLRSNILDAIDRHSAALKLPEGTDRSSFAVAMSTLKISSGELAIEVIQHALQICGIAGYRNTGPQSVARNLRDIYSSLIMINNDRIESNIAMLLTATKHDATLAR